MNTKKMDIMYSLSWETDHESLRKRGDTFPIRNDWDWLLDSTKWQSGDLLEGWHQQRNSRCGFALSVEITGYYVTSC